MTQTDREKWDERYAEDHGRRPPPKWLDDIADRLPTTGRALDVAAGRGRIARWLGDRGLEVLAIDLSPVGLALIDHPNVDTRALDLESESLPDGPFDVVTMFFYRQPSLGPALRAALAPGGKLVVMHPTVQNLERHARPPRHYLAEPSEVRALAEGLKIELYEESWRDGYHTARLIARAPQSDGERSA